MKKDDAMAKKRALSARTVAKPSTKKSAKAQAKPKKKKTQKKAVLKTAANNASVAKFLQTVSPDRRDDCLRLIDIMSKITGAEPRMWGTSIVGFGSYHYRYASGREGTWFETGFSPRKQALTLYIMGGTEQQQKLLPALGPYKTGKSCLYVKNLDSIHLPTLKKMIRSSVKFMRQHPDGSACC